MTIIEMMAARRAKNKAIAEAALAEANKAADELELVIAMQEKLVEELQADPWKSGDYQRAVDAEAVRVPLTLLYVLTLVSEESRRCRGGDSCS